MRYTAEIDFNAKIDSFSDYKLNLAGTGLKFASVWGIPCAYFGSFSGQIQCSFYMIPYTVPENFKAFRYKKGSNSIEEIDKEKPEEKKLSKGVQIMILSDIEPIENALTAVNSFTSIPIHDLFPHIKLPNLIDLFTKKSACLGVKADNSNETIYFYEWKRGDTVYCCIPLFYPNLTSVFYYYPKDNDSNNILRLEKILSTNLMEIGTNSKKTKSFPFTQNIEDKIVCDEDASGAMFMENLCLKINNEDNEIVYSITNLKEEEYTIKQSQLLPNNKD